MENIAVAMAIISRYYGLIFAHKAHPT